MAKPYASYFDNFFAALRMARPPFKAQASYALRAARQAKLDQVFDPLLADLAQAIDSFDEKLTDRQEPTAGDTGAYQLARQAWLTFVDDAMKDYVTPRLRKLPMYADFKKFGKSKLAALKQPELLIQSQKLVDLYAEHLALLKEPGLATAAAAALKAVAAADEAKDQSQAALGDTILGLEADRVAIARAQHRLKAQLELTFDDPAKVYSFFDFSEADNARQLRKRASKKTDRQDDQILPN